jgi:IPT/TIG domain
MKRSLPFFMVIVLCTGLVLFSVPRAASAPKCASPGTATIGAGQSKQVLTFTENFLKGLSLTGGYYSCLKQQPPYTFFSQDWYGVSLSYLLDQVVGLLDSTSSVKVCAKDGAEADLTLSRIRNANSQGLFTILAWQKGTQGGPHQEPPLTALSETEDGIFRLALGQSPNVGDYASGGTPNFPYFIKWVRTIEVLPLPAGMAPVDPSTVPAGQIVVYGNIRAVKIDSVSPGSGVTGSDVILSGRGFGASRGTSYISFNSKKATSYESWSDTTIKCKVPEVPLGSVSVTVTTSVGTSNSGRFTVLKEPPGPPFYFAEGTCRPGFDPYLCVQNPGGKDAAVTITFMKGDGSTQQTSLSVKKNSRSTVKVKDILGEGDDAAHDFSSRVECTNGQQIIAERPMYFDYNGWTGGHDVVGFVPSP